MYGRCIITIQQESLQSKHQHKTQELLLQKKLDKNKEI